MDEEIKVVLDENKVNEGFVIDDDSKADWAARIILEEAEERDRLLALVKAERERLDAKEEEIRRRYEQKTEYLSGQLLSYMAEAKTRDTATQKSYKLLNATLVYKKAKMDVAPGDGLVDWLEANRPEFVKVEKKPDWAAVKKHVTQIGEGVYALDDTGEILEGIVPKEVPGKFEVKA